MKNMKLLPLILAAIALVCLSACASVEPSAPAEQIPVAEAPIVEEPIAEETIAEEPVAVEPIIEEAVAEQPSPAPQCTVSISCAELLDNMSLLAEEKHELVPADGVLLPPTSVALAGGESVFDVIVSAVRANNLHMEYTQGVTSYIEGVCNLYEFDAGPASGWTYSVGGTFPNLDSGAYLVQAGDNIQLVYSLTPKTGQ